MTDKKLMDILPEKISAETAHHLAIFMMDLALAIEDHYFGQLMHSSKEGLEDPELID